MNRRQITAMWIGVALIGALTFFVPYVITPGPGAMMESMFNAKGAVILKPTVHYAPLFAPPPGGLNIDWPRVAACEALVGLVTLGAIFSLGTRRDGIA